MSNIYQFYMYNYRYTIDWYYNTFFLCASGAEGPKCRARDTFDSERGNIIQLLTLIMLCILCTIPQCASEILSRVNYGVLFDPIRTAFAVHDYWMHTFEVETHQMIAHRMPSVTCSWNDTNHPCYYYENVHKSRDKMQEEYYTMLNETLAQLEDALDLPEHNMDHNNDFRSKRKIFGFIGELSHTIFGTATEKDVKLVAAHVEKLENRSALMAKMLSNFTQDLSSFMTVSSKRMNNLKQQIVDEHDAISKLSVLYQHLSTHETRQALLIMKIIKEHHYTFVYHAAVSQFLQGAQDLLQDKLSMYLVPYREITQVMNAINQKLQKRRTDLQIMTLNSKDIYGHLPFVWTYRNESIFITLKFPLVSPLSKINVYKVHYFSIPLNESTDHATKLSESYPYFAVTTNHEYYALPNERTIAQMKSNILDVQRDNFPLINFQKQSCLSELYLNNKGDIKKFCEFKIQLGTLEPSITHIDHGKYLIINQTEIIMVCPQGVSSLPGCKFCVHEVKCLCSLSSTNFYFPARVTHCSDTKSAATSHPINLAFLQHFYTDKDLQHIEPDSRYSGVPLVDTPPINLFTHNWTEFLAADEDAGLSLKKVAHAFKEQKQVFKQLSEPILDSLSDQLGKSDLFSWQSLVIFINVGLTVLALALIVYLIIKINMMQAAITALTLLPKMESRDPFFLIPTTTTMPPPVESTDEHFTVERMLLYSLILSSTLTLLFLICSRLNKRSTRASIGLEISNNTHCVLLPLFQVPNCPKFYHCQADNGFSDLKVEGCLFPRFTWNKGSLMMTHTLDQSRPTIPQSVRISIWKAMKLKHMLRGPVYAYIIAEHCNRVFQVQVCPLACENCVLQVKVVQPGPH